MSQEEELLRAAEGQRPAARREPERTVGTKRKQHAQRGHPPQATPPPSAEREQQRRQADVEGQQVGEALGEVRPPPVVGVGEGVGLAEKLRQEGLAQLHRVEGEGERLPGVGKPRTRAEPSRRARVPRSAGAARTRESAPAPSRRSQRRSSLKARQSRRNEADDGGLQDDLRAQRARLQGGERREDGDAPAVRPAHRREQGVEDPRRPHRRLEELHQADGGQHEPSQPVDGARHPGPPGAHPEAAREPAWRRRARAAGAGRRPRRAAHALRRAGGARGPPGRPAASARRRCSWDSTAATRRGEATPQRRHSSARSTTTGRGSRGGAPRRARRRTARGRGEGGRRATASQAQAAGRRSVSSRSPATARSAGAARPLLVMLGAHVSIRPVTRWRRPPAPR